MTPFFLLQQITYRILIEFTIACWIALRLCLKLLITLGLTLRSYSIFVECHFTFIQYHTKKTSRTTSPVASSSIHSLLKRMFTWPALESRVSILPRITYKNNFITVIQKTFLKKQKEKFYKSKLKKNKKFVYCTFWFLNSWYNIQHFPVIVFLC